MRSTLAFSLLAAASLAGCATRVPAPSTPPAAVHAPAGAATPGPPPDDALNATAWYQTAVERDLVYREVYRAAGERLAAALADTGWDALPKEDRANDPRPLPPAIIVDIDETVLDNAPNQVRQLREHRGFDKTAWAAWVEERKARALPGAVDFLRAAAGRGITVFYVSNRDAAQARATVDALRRAGFPLADEAQFLGLGTVVEGCAQDGSEKSCRRRLVGRTHRVLMQFGDQVGDFVQVVANTPQGRRAAIAPYADWIGQRWWVLPNPMYGAWESALFDNAWGRPEGERRALKHSSLDDAK